ATDVGGNRELIEHDACGTLVSANDSTALAQALERYARETGVRERHGKRARRRAVEHFGIDRMITDYEKLYTDLLLRHRVMKPQWATSADDPPALARTGTN